MGVLHDLQRKTGLVQALEAELRSLREQLAMAAAARDAVVAERDELKSHLTRLDTQSAEAWGIVQQQREDLQVTQGQRDALEMERDGLQQHVVRLEAQRDEAESRARELGSRLAEAEKQRDVLEKERDSLRGHNERLLLEVDEHLARLKELEEAPSRWQGRTWIEPGHFYSPLVDPQDRDVKVVLARQAHPQPEGWSHPLIDDGRMLEMLERLGRQVVECPFPENATPGKRYYFDNPAYSYGDAATLFGMMREFRPQRVIEVGCGYSSAAILDTRDVTPGVARETTFIDPFPEVLLSLLDEHDPAQASIRREPLQQAPIALFEALEANDLLLIDSSHVLKMGSDVQDYLFRILPAVRPGVLIHVHDIFFPFEYPVDWIVKENRSWNEAYGLHAFLAFNPQFRIEFFNDYVYRKFATRAAAVIPQSQRSPGGSLWIRRIA